MKKIISIFLISGLIVFSIQSCGGDKQTNTTNDTTVGPPPPPTVAPPPSSSASVGKSLYEGKCTMCHGGDGTAGTMGAADLSASKLDHAGVISMIKTGKNSMKSFSPELNDAQIDAVATYIESLRK